MKSILNQLSPKDKEALARLYDTDMHEALKKVHRLTIAGLGQDALVAPDMNVKERLQGRALQSKILMDLIREVYQQVNKES